MPFNKAKLTEDFLSALASSVPEDDDKTRDMLRGVAETMANGVELNPGITTVDNEEKVALLESKVDDLEKKVADFQNFLDDIDARIGTVETKTSQLQ